MNKSGFMKDAVILFIITLVAGICLGGVYEMTKVPIQKANMASKREIYMTVFEKANDFRPTDKLTEAAKTATELLLSQNFGNVTVEDIVAAEDSAGTVLGYVVSATSKDGYGGAISISVGIDLQQMVTGIEFLEIAETPGLGMNAVNSDFKDSFKDKTIEYFTVTKGSASSQDEIDAISGATITSNAVANAVNAALFSIRNCVLQ